MTNGTDSDAAPVADPTPDGEGETRWPTWSDISRLHHIPAASRPTGTSDASGPENRADDIAGPAASDARTQASPPAATAAVPAPRRPGSAAAPTPEPRIDDADGPETAQRPGVAGSAAAPEPVVGGDVPATGFGAAESADDAPLAAQADDVRPVAPESAAEGAAAEAGADAGLSATAEQAAGSAPEPTSGASTVDSSDAAPSTDSADSSDAAVSSDTAGRTATAEPAATAAPTATVPSSVAAGPADAPTQRLEPQVAHVRTKAFPATAVGGAPSPHVAGGAVPVVVREPSVLDAFDPDDGRRRWPRQLAIVVGIVVLLVGAYAGASYALGHRVPRGATVAGVDIGGLTQTAAVDRLTSRLGAATTGGLSVKAGDQQSELDPVKAGLTFDAAATVRRLVGVDLLQPVRLWNQLVGVGAQPAVTAVDAAALHTAVQQLADALQVDPVDGSIVFADGKAHATPAQDGTDVDVPAAEKAIRDGWLVGARPLLLPTRSVAPDITQAETDAALTEVAQRVAGAPVTVTVADRTVSLPAATLVASSSFVAQDGTLVLQMNGPALVSQVLAQTPGLVTAASDAHFEFQNDAPVLVPGTPGTTIDPNALAAAVATAASSATQRTATVSLVPSDPSQSTAALQALGVKEIVSEFATPLTSEPHRTVNITVGAAKINGVLVKPGDTFSLGASLSPMDAAHGYIDAGAIVDGEHVQALGGGLSQVSTTTFNAAYFAGFEDVQHQPHSEWFTRYPEGREATIYYPTLDMKWKNNTPYGALIQSWVADNQLHVRIWGTKYWTVTSTTSARSNVHAPTTVYDQSPQCTPQPAGNPGFTVTVTRQLSLDGALKQTTSRTTSYKAQDNIVCGPAPSTTSPSPTP